MATRNTNFFATDPPLPSESPGSLAPSRIILPGFFLSH
jgi:hypothetical protein